MTPAALSRITWTVDDRRAWLAAYADARRVARVRSRRERQASDRAVALYGTLRHSVSADILAARTRKESERHSLTCYVCGEEMHPVTASGVCLTCPIPIPADAPSGYNVAILAARESAREIEEAFSGIQHDGIGWCVLNARGRTVSRYDTFEDAGRAFRGTL